MRQIATVLCLASIGGIFFFDRDRDHHTSGALWIPIFYLLINCSRPFSVWLGIAPAGSESEVYLNGSPVDRAVELMLLVAAIIILVRRGAQVGMLLRRNGPILLFFAFAALSVCWSDFPFVTLKHWTKGVCDLAMVLVVATELDPEYAIKQTLARVGFVLIPLSLLLSKYYPLVGRFISPGWVTEYSGVTLNKNQLGQICMIFGVASLWCLVSYSHLKDRTRLRHMLAHLVVLSIVIWLFVMINAMTSLSAFILSGVALLLVSRLARAPRLSKVHLVVAGVLCCALFALFFDTSGDLVKALGRNPTLTGRTDIWRWVPTLVTNPLIGTGYESFFLGPRLHEFWRLDNGAFRSLQEAHNGYIEVYLNLGWIGVALFANLLVDGYRKVTAAFRKNLRVGTLALSFLIAGVIYSLTEAGFRMQTPIWILLLWGIVGTSQDTMAKIPLNSTAKQGHVPKPERIGFSNHGVPPVPVEVPIGIGNLVGPHWNTRSPRLGASDEHRLSSEAVEG